MPAAGPIRPSLPWCLRPAARRGGDRKGSHGTMLTACGKLVSRQFRKQRLARWAAGRGPDPSFTAMVFEACGTVLGPELTAQKGKQHGTMLTACGKLVSRQFRKQRLARWAAGRGPDPSFTAMVFEACGTVLGPELTAGKSKG